MDSENTDIEKLHNVILGKVKGRCIEKKHLLYHNLAGTIEVGRFNTIIVALKSFNDFNYIFPMLRQVLSEHDLKIESLNLQERCFTCSGKKIIFKVLVNEYQWIRISGLIGNFVDLRED